MRSITSQALDLIKRLPFLYITTGEPDIMRTLGVAGEGSVADTERLYQGALIAPHYAGESASRGDLLYNGAEPAASFNAVQRRVAELSQPIAAMTGARANAC